MPRIDQDQIPTRTGADYPAPFAEQVGQRLKQALGKAGGLSDIGVNLTQLPPGAWSSLRHWHTHEEEFAYVLSGELTLITNAGEQVLRVGDSVTFPKNTPDGHHFINRGQTTATYLEVGTRRDEDVCSYPDADLHWDQDRGYTHKDGTAYPVALR